MSKIIELYDHILKYLKDLLSNKERHDLERQMANDPFSEEAFEGLTMLKGEELEADMSLLADRLDERLEKKRRLLINPIWRVAAVAVLICGAVAVLFIVLKPPAQDLITQDAGKKQEAPAETKVPPVPGSSKAPEINDNNEVQSRQADQKTSTIALAEDYQEIDEIVSNQTVAEQADILQAPVQNERSAQLESESAPATGETAETNYITGRILGVNRKALPGVSLAEEGTGRVTETDMDGTFRMKVSHPSSKIELSRQGYKNLEVSSGEIAGKEISLDEERKTEEIVVLAYSDEELVKPLPESAAKAKAQKSSVDPYKRPLPPGGSMKEFEAWVESRIDTMQLKQLLPGNYRIQVRLTVYKDGRIGNISVPDDIPDIASVEYKNAISMSERWQPAMVGNLPVDSDIVIEFSLTIK